MSETDDDDTIEHEEDPFATMEPADIAGSKLEWSTIEVPDRKFNKDRNRGGNGKPHRCLYCDEEWQTGGPREIRSHFDIGEPRWRSICCPRPEFRERVKAVTAELVHRRLQKEISRKRRLSPRQRLSEGSDGSGESPAFERVGGPEKKRRRDEVDEAWAYAFAESALPFSCADRLHFRRAIFLTAKAGEDYVNGDDSRLPKRTTFVGSVIKDAGDKLDARVGSRVTKAAEESGGTIVSDGCRSTSKDACLNVLFETSAGTQFISSIAATEVKKDMQYIARHIIDHIKKIGAANVTAVIMDGACVGAFKYITAKFKHVHCFICPTHSLDNFIKNICSDKPTITVKGHENCPQATFVWGESLFSKALQRVKTVVKTVTRYQKTLDIYRRLKKEANAHLESDAEQYKDLIKYCDTRFMSQLLMTIRYSKSLLILERLLLDGSFNSWLSGESRQTKKKVKSMV